MSYETKNSNITGVGSKFETIGEIEESKGFIGSLNKEKPILKLDM